MSHQRWRHLCAWGRGWVSQASVGVCVCVACTEEALRVLALGPLHECTCFVCVSLPAYSACVCLTKGVYVCRSRWPRSTV